ncbi:serine--tRNA ligase [Fimbriiglobus ruber]|uniref:Serine--tRNA ligase n=1 Tax=Fimbriiglobus ruber TaxID=1908690 RepID=A0A225CZV7_9BACT|nr:serine--tRNA ligase [Fimbriiglobus ruber]OWK34861.1 Seryl-tRNA synthetase [Fimbriiglobus ruber]
MLDAAFIRDNVEAVKQNCVNRAVKNAEVDRVVQLDAERKQIQRQYDSLKQEQNQISDQIKGAGKDKELRDSLVAKSRGMKEQLTGLEGQVKKLEDDLRAALHTIPNMTHPAAPVGTTAEDNKVVAVHGTLPTFDFKPKDHVDLFTALDLADMEAGAKVAGQKFYFLKNEGALLELALVQYAVSTLVKEGFTPVITPDLAKTSVMEGTGYMPRDSNPDTRQFYTIADTDLCLIATAEITIGGMHMDEILDEENLPRKYAGLSHCFRTEAGAAGRDTRGLYRVHQFTKVEMFAFCTPEQSDAIHEEIRAIEEKIFQGLGLPYHVIDTCTGDLGGPAYRKYDLEAWMPGRGTKGEYGEVTSTSNCTDYQARRLNIRYRQKEKKGTRFVHTLNGTAVACTRALVAILENYQQADGSVVVPEALRPWVGKDVIVPRVKK